jgi:hypothetical protein
MLVGLYTLISLTVLSTSVLTNWARTHSFFQAWAILFDERSSLSILLNACAIIFLHMGYKLQHFVFGTMEASEMTELGNALGAASLLGLFISLTCYENTPSFSILHFLFPAALGFVAEVFLVRVRRFSLVQRSAVPAVHSRIFFFQVLLLLLQVHLAVTAIPLYSFSALMGYLVQDGLGIICSVQGLVVHVLFLIDAEGHGHSMHIFRTEVIVDLALQVARLVILLSGCFATGGYAIGGQLYECINAIRVLVPWIRMWSAVSRNLRPPRGAELADDCIICRAELSGEASRVLPCGHCCHVNCILRWARTRMECPLCQADLTQILRMRPGDQDRLTVVEPVTDAEVIDFKTCMVDEERARQAKTLAALKAKLAAKEEELKKLTANLRQPREEFRE